MARANGTAYQTSPPQVNQSLSKQQISNIMKSGSMPITENHKTEQASESLYTKQ
jgi:hypothetical protein